jgi:hypothetical protein
MPALVYHHEKGWQKVPDFTCVWENPRLESRQLSRTLVTPGASQMPAMVINLRNPEIIVFTDIMAAL